MQALYDAADDDSATGGPDLTRRIFPVVGVITADGYRRLPDAEVAADRRPGDRRPDAAPRRPRRRPDLTVRDPPVELQTRHRRGAPHEHAVLRLARAADEGPGGLRPQGHRPRPLASSSCSTPTASCSSRRTPPQALHKVSEIYDRIAFAAVGRYNEFENLRIAGVRLADMRGYSYDRRDVTGRGLANAYAQTLGTIFSSGGEKPYEVEIFVAEVGDTVADDQIYRLTYDGQVADEHGYAVMGGVGRAGRRRTSRSTTRAGADARRRAPARGRRRSATARPAHRGRSRSSDLEVAVLDRTRTQQRKFKRLDDTALAHRAGRAPSRRRRPRTEPPCPRGNRRRHEQRDARRSSPGAALKAPRTNLPSRPEPTSRPDTWPCLSSLRTHALRATA